MISTYLILVKTRSPWWWINYLQSNLNGECVSDKQRISLMVLPDDKRKPNFRVWIVSFFLGVFCWFELSFSFYFCLKCEFYEVCMCFGIFITNDLLWQFQRTHILSRDDIRFTGMIVCIILEMPNLLREGDTIDDLVHKTVQLKYEH